MTDGRRYVSPRNAHKKRSYGKQPSRTSRGSDIGSGFHDHRKISFSDSDRQNHTHVIGSTGTGKSKFLELLLREDIRKRNTGLCLIDPHGSLYEEVLLYASHRHPSLAEKFILFNPAGELEHVLGFNPVHPDTDQLDYLLDSLISACLKAWGQDDTDRTPRITKWLENIFYTIMCNDLTLVETAPLLSIHNKEHRAALLSNVHNDLVLDDWRMFEVSSNTQKQALIEGAANRLRKFLRNEHIRNIVGQRDRVLDFSAAMDEGKIVLINLNGQGVISHENMKLLGVLIVNEVFRCAKLRDFRDPKLKPFYLYIDEFAQFVTRDIARTLEEARKFKLFAILAHQHLAQLQKEDEYLYASVLTNCRNKVVFGGLSREDAEIMAQEVATGFVDLKSVKDEIYTTKSRQRLEKRIVHNWSEGTTDSESSGTSEGKSSSHSVGKSLTRSLGKTLGKSITNTIGRSHAQNRSTTESETTTEGESVSEGRSVSGSPFGNAGEALIARLTGQEANPTGWGQQASRSQSFSRSGGTSYTTGDTHTDSSSTAKGTSESDTETSGEGSSSTTGTSQSQSRTKSSTKGTTQSKGSAETWVTEQDEYQELSSRTFWSLQELEYMQLAALKNQGTAEAFIKVRDGEPQRVQIKHVDSIYYHPRTSPKKLERFRENAIANNPECFTPVEEVYVERQRRQVAAFGEPLRLDSQAVEIEVIEDSEPHADDPFT